MTSPYDAFLLVSFGGPEGPDDVMPFLENVTRGRGVPRERLETVAHHYLALGGISPINDQNRRLVVELRAAFDARAIDLPIYWGNRNWAPYLATELERIHADGHQRVLALATSAYASYSGCRQYREDLAAARTSAGLDGRLEIDKVRPYFALPGFIDTFVDGLTAALVELAGSGIAPHETRVLFTTHSIPLTMAAASGPPGRYGAGGAYLAQHRATAASVVAGVRAAGHVVPPHDLVYQSRSGAPHVPWLEPDINDALRDAHAGGMRAAVVVPIGFVSDHVEVIWDLDREAQQTCDDLGLRMIRVATPGTHPSFVAGLAGLVKECVTGSAVPPPDTLDPWPSVCSVECCTGPGGDVPAVAGATGPPPTDDAPDRR